MINVGKMVAAAAIPVVVGAGAAEVATDEHVKLFVYLGATVTATVSVVTWVRHEIRKETDAQTRFIMRELRHFRALLAVRFEMPELDPGPETTDEIDLRPQKGKKAVS